MADVTEDDTWISTKSNERYRDRLASQDQCAYLITRTLGLPAELRQVILSNAVRISLSAPFAIFVNKDVLEYEYIYEYDIEPLTKHILPEDRFELGSVFALYDCLFHSRNHRQDFFDVCDVQPLGPWLRDLKDMSHRPKRSLLDLLVDCEGEVRISECERAKELAEAMDEYIDMVKGFGWMFTLLAARVHSPSLKTRVLGVMVDLRTFDGMAIARSR